MRGSFIDELHCFVGHLICVIFWELDLLLSCGNLFYFNRLLSQVNIFLMLSPLFYIHNLQMPVCQTVKVCTVTEYYILIASAPTYS